MQPLNNITVLITGASRGLGAAIARTCAKQGANLILHYGNSKTAVQNLADELGSHVVATLSYDLSRPQAGTMLWQEALKIAPELNALVNNAGCADAVDFASSDQDWQDGWSRTLSINLQAPADLCRAAVASFAKQKTGGRIVNIASRAGQRGDQMDFAAYAASKGALLALTRTIAKGAAAQGVSAFAIAPGWIDTEMAPTDPTIRKQATAEIPYGKFADPAEIAALTAFLLSGACPSATGATFDINGASYLR
ncbi:3-oxoacyl-[acyl-carrier protein] reductase [hydrothermal vent metagenome]|uniref:3-oxoacyl-[acyl-carrier protein] reductase n=1 Tax=hydrothermal vent metagenome TaxID=652676 RepID=A0A3B0RHU3_9ZZZZ